MSEWGPVIRREPTPQGPATMITGEGADKELGKKRQRGYRGLLMALADEDLRLSVAGKQQLGA